MSRFEKAIAAFSSIVAAGFSGVFLMAWYIATKHESFHVVFAFNALGEGIIEGVILVIALFTSIFSSIVLVKNL